MTLLFLVKNFILTKTLRIFNLKKTKNEEVNYDEKSFIVCFYYCSNGYD